jgi:hypothetical protein
LHRRLWPGNANVFDAVGPRADNRVGNKTRFVVADIAAFIEKGAHNAMDSYNVSEVSK